MSRSNKKTAAKAALLWVAGVLGCIGTWQWVDFTMRIDPFADLREDVKGPLGDEVSMRIPNAKFRLYKKGRLWADANVARIDVRRTKSVIDMVSLTDGHYYGTGNAIKFEGKQAQWNSFSRHFQVMGGARAWGDKFDLRPDAFTYFDGQDLLVINGKVSGMLQGGTITADAVRIAHGGETFDVGEFAWKGELPKEYQETAGTQTSGRIWNIKGKSGSMKRGTNLYVATDAQATDGDIVIMSPRIEHDKVTDVLTAYEPVKYYSAESNVLCKKAIVYRKEKRAILTGEVQVFLKPEDQEKLEVVEIEPFRPIVPDEIAKGRPAQQKSPEEKKLDEELRSVKSARKYPSTIYADKVEYWYRKGERRAVITGRPQARQLLPRDKWRMVWASKAYYDGEKDTLRLVSEPENERKVRVKTSLGDDVFCAWFVTSTKEDEDDYEFFDFVGDLYSDDDEELPKRNTGPPPTGGGNGPPPEKPNPKLRGPIGSRTAKI